MLGNSPLCCPNSLSPSLSFPSPQRLTAFTLPARPTSSIGASLRLPLLSNHSQCHNRNLHHRHSTHSCSTSATQEIVETSKSEFNFVEVGYIASAHGLQGEVRVKTSSDFPELRFTKPGTRWLRQRVLGREMVQEVELVGGRCHPGQKGWIVKFMGYDTSDLAKQLVGSTILVREEDRPELQDGEFYTRDLVGMRIVLKETRELVGVVVKVFNFGASDLLQVSLDSSKERKNVTGKPKIGTHDSAPLVWVPFVEPIVPIVDMDKREMLITPPKGLLDLNMRTDGRTKKERRLLEWKQRKKLQRLVIAAKKKLIEMDQQHVLHGFKFGDKAQKSLLADEIVGLNPRLLQLQLQKIMTPSKRWYFKEFMSANSEKLMRSFLEMPEQPGTQCSTERNLDSNIKFLQNGVDMMSRGKVAIVLVVNEVTKSVCGHDLDPLDPESTLPCPILQKLLDGADGNFFLKMEDRASVPLILVCPAQETQYLIELFSDNDHFAFDSQKVWFLEEEELPVISSSAGAENGNKILMKSPWEILKLPMGSGGVISLLSSNGILDKLCEMGAEYIEVCSSTQGLVNESPTLLGFVDSRKADLGFQMPPDTNNYEDTFDMIFSMGFMKKLVKHIHKLNFQAVLKPNSYVAKVGEEWVDAIPSCPNSYEFCCSIYSSLNVCSSDKICVLKTAR